MSPEIIEEKVLCCRDRSEWRAWLSSNFNSSDEVWFVFPIKDSGETGVTYNDAVEEALCFGWIDSTAKRLDDTHQVRRFTPRRKDSLYSRPNIERLIWLDSKDMIHPDVRSSVIQLIETEYVFPEDIIEMISKEPEVLKNYQSFSEPYKRIRVAYIDAARDRPEEFRKRLENFISMTKKNKMIGGYGGIDKYYFEIERQIDSHSSHTVIHGNKHLRRGCLGDSEKG